MKNLLITNHALMSEAQKHLAQVLWHFAAKLRDVRNRTDDESSVIMYELSAALRGIWSNYSDLSYRVMLSNVRMYMRPTITSENFNFIAWNALKQLKPLSIKYKKSFRRNYAIFSENINSELRNLEAWHIRVIAKVEQVTMNARPLLAVLDNDVLGEIVQKAAIADTPL